MTVEEGGEEGSMYGTLGLNITKLLYFFTVSDYVDGEVVIVIVTVVGF